jgi:hypothetical protein
MKGSAVPPGFLLSGATMSEERSPGVSDLTVYTVRDLLKERWKKCNIETLQRILERYPLVMEHRRTRKRGTLQELRDSHSQGFFGFDWKEDALFRECDLQAFEADPRYSDIIAVVREGARADSVSGKGSRNIKSERRKEAVREIAKARLKEAGDRQESVSFGKPFREDPEVLKATEDHVYDPSWYSRVLKGIRSEDKSKPGRKKKQDTPSE